jgi:hypothetical protein
MIMEQEESEPLPNGWHNQLVGNKQVNVQQRQLEQKDKELKR